jgi:hypothetical protein
MTIRGRERAVHALKKFVDGWLGGWFLMRLRISRADKKSHPLILVAGRFYFSPSLLAWLYISLNWAIWSIYVGHGNLGKVGPGESMFLKSLYTSEQCHLYLFLFVCYCVCHTGISDGGKDQSLYVTLLLVMVSNPSMPHVLDRGPQSSTMV